MIKYFCRRGAHPKLSGSEIPGGQEDQFSSSRPGATPPFVLSYNASTVPILQLALSSPTLPEAHIFDLANTILRTQLSTVQDPSIPFPFAGKQRQLQGGLDPQALSPTRINVPTDLHAHPP